VVELDLLDPTRLAEVEAPGIVGVDRAHLGRDEAIGGDGEHLAGGQFDRPVVDMSLAGLHVPVRPDASRSGIRALVR